MYSFIDDRLRCRHQPLDDRQQIETEHGQDRAPLDRVATQPVPIPGPMGPALQLGADTVGLPSHRRSPQMTADHYRST